MARNKEALLLLLDVSPSMHPVLPVIEKICRSLVQKKLIYHRTDEVGIILFGTEETNNELESEVGGYEHVVALQNIKVVDGDTLNALTDLSKGSASGDFLDAVIVGMDMLIKKFGDTNKGKRRLCLITGARDPIKEPAEGTKEDQVDILLSKMESHGMHMDCVVVRGELIGTINQSIANENDLLLQRFSKTGAAKVISVENVASLVGALKTRNISPVTIFRGDLELSPIMTIKVWVYKKVSEERLPTLKRYSDMAPSSDKFATHEVKVDFEYKRVEDETKVVPPEQRIRGYRYGPQVVPISSAELDLIKFKTEKGIKLLGVTDASNIMRHYYMKESYVVIAEPGNSKAMVAVSALARSMKQSRKVAILRCVWRQGQANVVIGALTPDISSTPDIPDSFYLNVLPFAEDVREFPFPSFSKLPSSKQPSEKQLEAAEDLVRMLDLAPSEEKEMLQPDLTPNPVLERFYDSLELRSKEPDAPLPPVDENLKCLIEPDDRLITQNNFMIDFVNQFELKENPKIKKSTRRIRKDQPSYSDEGADKHPDDLTDVQKTITYDAADGKEKKIDKIRPEMAIEDFQLMMARRDGNEWISKAIKEMKKVIVDLLGNAKDGDTFQNAVECVAALRRGCVVEQEPKEFNQFLHHLHGCFEDKSFRSFWELLFSKDITLITKTEAEDSDVADEFACFLVKTEAR